MLKQQTAELRDPYRNIYSDSDVEFQKVVVLTKAQQIIDNISNWKPFKMRIDFDEYADLVDISRSVQNAHTRWLQRIESAIDTSYNTQFNQSYTIGSREYERDVHIIAIEKQDESIDPNNEEIYELRAEPFYRVTKDNKMIYDMRIEFGPLYKSKGVHGGTHYYWDKELGEPWNQEETIVPLTVGEYDEIYGFEQ